MKLLSKILFFLSSFSILPPVRSKQDLVIEQVYSKHTNDDEFLKNSLSQYDCQVHYFLRTVWYIFNIFSVVSVLPLIFFLSVLGFKKSKLSQLNDISLYPKVPTDIKKRFGPTFVKKRLGYLKLRDFKYVFKIMFKSGFRPYFVFRSIWKIAIYSELIDNYSPKRVWVTQEMVFESSILTHYLGDFSIEHINFQHGDNFFSIQIAFSSFHKFYIWDEYYTKLFNSLRMKVGEYCLFSSIDRLTSDFPQRNIIKYYSQDERPSEEFSKILDNLQAFSKAHGCDLVVRLHPLHRAQHQFDMLNSRKIEIEPNSVDLVDSLYESKYICSEFSSVLYQASLLNREIVVDNTFKERFDIIKDLDVIFLKKLKHEYLVTV